MDNDNPYLYIEYASQYNKSYIIIKKQTDRLDLLFVKSFLLGRTIELILKTELILEDFTSKELKDPKIAGHDLINTFNLLKKPEFFKASPFLIETIGHLNKFYNPKGYEYPKKHDIEIRNVAFLEEFIKVSMDLLKNKLSSPEILSKYTS